MEGLFDRTRALLGDEAMRVLEGACVAVVGIGGVGGHCAEALARCGIGRFVLVDGDRVSITNRNRQIIALSSTAGEYKAEAMRQRMLDINPDIGVDVLCGYYGPQDDLGLWERPLDLVVDAIDMVTSKVELALEAQRRGIACVSAMGAGDKLDPARFEAADLYDTSVCPLCRATRRLARERGVMRLRVVYSKEPPAAQRSALVTPEEGRRHTPGSIAYVTASAGLLLAREAVNLLLETAEIPRGNASGRDIKGFAPRNNKTTD